MSSFTSAIDHFWRTVTAPGGTGELIDKARGLLRSEPSFVTPVQLWSPPGSNTKHQRGVLFQHGASGRFSAVEIGTEHDSLPPSFPVLEDDTEYTPCAVLMDYDETTKQGILLVWKNERKSPYSLFVSSFSYVLRQTYGLTLALEPDLDPNLLEATLMSGGLRELRLTQTQPFKDRSDYFESGELAERDISLTLSLKHSRKRPFKFSIAKDFAIAKIRRDSKAAGEAFRQMREELGIGDFTYEQAAAVVELIVGNDRKEKVFSLDDEEPGRGLNERIDDTLDGLPEQLIKTQEIDRSTVETLFERLTSVL
jgi:hypothetical protein